MMERQEFALTKIRNIINSQQIQIGQRLPTERKLAEEFGVGRRTVRRALDLLEKEGRIKRRQGQGTFVEGAKSIAKETPNLSGIDAFMENASPVEVIEARLTIEPMLAQLAALRASNCDIKKLLTLAEETRITKCAEQYERADTEFHRRVVIAANNNLFLSFFDALISMRNDISWHQLGENNRCFNQQVAYATHHHKIADAVANRDGVRARDLMFEHLRDIQTRFICQTYP